MTSTPGDKVYRPNMTETFRVCDMEDGKVYGIKEYALVRFGDDVIELQGGRAYKSKVSDWARGFRLPRANRITVTVE
jgi:hypothetical protein